MKMRNKSYENRVDGGVSIMIRWLSTGLPIWESGDSWRHADSTTWNTKQRKSALLEEAKDG